MTATLETLTLEGLTPAVAQVWERVRLVPLIRRRVRGDLRFGVRRYDDGPRRVDLGGRPGAPNRQSYHSYIPHGLVVGWTRDGADVAAETMLADGPDAASAGRRLTAHHRMVRREARGPQSRLRMLPLHVAMEAYLGLHFGGPTIAWPEYSARVLRRGLSPRAEWVVPGHALPDLADALRLFEIHEGQCGLLIFVGGRLAAATVVSDPADYRRIHRTLIEDVYGEMLAWSAWYAAAAPPAPIRIDGGAVHDWPSLGGALRAARDGWARVELDLAGGLLGRPVIAERVYGMGPFELLRFDTRFEPGLENHIGEAIVRDDGTLEYLKTYSLTRDQLRRGRLLRDLAAADWHLATAAAARGQSTAMLVDDLNRVGFGWLLKPGA